MKTFHCDHCGHLLFFENVKCVTCKHALAYLPDLAIIGSLDPAGDGLWTCPLPQTVGQKYRLCQNYAQGNVCNWAVSSSDDHAFCRSCRLTRVIPDQSQAGMREAWCRLETAKRRLVYSLLTLGLPLASKADDPKRGLSFEFLNALPGAGNAPVLTGHNDGVITIHVAEADDAEREKRRVQLHEPYRTLLGHFRHEVGHYYWDRLIGGSDRLESFRGLFGDERQDYGQALQTYYKQGPPASWPERFVSAYASSHPWEDWAETWAHYLHMADALETSFSCGLSLQPRRPDEPSLKAAFAGLPSEALAFDKMIDDWFSLTYLLNSLNRGLGLRDAYPFVLSAPGIEKLRFVHETIRRTATKKKAQPISATAASI